MREVHSRSAMLPEYWSRTQESNLHLPRPKRGDLPISPMRDKTLAVPGGNDPPPQQ